MSGGGVPVLDVSSWEVAVDETSGGGEGLWLIHPDTRVKWLFKPPIVKNGFRQGEDWSEKICAGLAQAISVPCAEVLLAVREGRPGSLSRNLRPVGWQLQPGSLLLAASIDGYQPGRENVKGRPGHSLRNIELVMRGAGQPPTAELPVQFTAFDVFAGYLVLDAWIANRDRHDENWSILLAEPPHHDERQLLCGSYDHAGALGYNVRDEVCGRLLTEDEGVAKWVSKGTAHRFEFDPATGPLTLVELANEALGMAGEQTRRYWLDRLERVTGEHVDQVVQGVQGLSVPCRTFVREVLRINRERVLNGCN